MFFLLCRVLHPISDCLNCKSLSADIVHTLQGVTNDLSSRCLVSLPQHVSHCLLNYAEQFAYQNDLYDLEVTILNYTVRLLEVCQCSFKQPEGRVRSKRTPEVVYVLPSHKYRAKLPTFLNKDLSSFMPKNTDSFRLKITSF